MLTILKLENLIGVLDVEEAEESTLTGIGRVESRSTSPNAAQNVVDVDTKIRMTTRTYE